MNNHSVSTLVYKYNPNGFWLIGIYIIGLFVFVFHLLSMSMTQILFFGSIFLAIPLYVQYGNSRKIRMMVWDERKLIFSSEAIDFGKDHFPVNELETAAIFLDSFDGFEFRGLRTPGMAAGGRLWVDRKADGDNNKISFRHNGQVEDFTFYLANYEQYAMFQTVINDWSAAGVNVVVSQTYDDNFIREEMVYYNTPTGESG